MIAPISLACFVLGGWEFLVRYNHVPIYILPGPILIAEDAYQRLGTLSGSLYITLSITLAALCRGCVRRAIRDLVFPIGVDRGVIFSLSRWPCRSRQ